MFYWPQRSHTGRAAGGRPAERPACGSCPGSAQTGWKDARTQQSFLKSAILPNAKRTTSGYWAGARTADAHAARPVSAARAARCSVRAWAAGHRPADAVPECALHAGVPPAAAPEAGAAAAPPVRGSGALASSTLTVPPPLPAPVGAPPGRRGAWSATGPLARLQHGRPRAAPESAGAAQTPGAQPRMVLSGAAPPLLSSSHAGPDARLSRPAPTPPPPPPARPDAHMATTSVQPAACARRAHAGAAAHSAPSRRQASRRSARARCCAAASLRLGRSSAAGCTCARAAVLSGRSGQVAAARSGFSRPAASSSAAHRVQECA